MIKKKASEIFAEVDPHLRVIDGGVRKHGSVAQRLEPSPHKREVVGSNPARPTDWEAAGGATCPRCGGEALWFRPGDGVCNNCAGFLDVKQDRDEKRQAKFLRQVKAHNARITKKKPRG